MRRRDFIVGIAGSTVLLPMSARAQRAGDPAPGGMLGTEAKVTAGKIDQFIEGVRSHVDAMAQPAWTAAGAIEQRRFASLQLLRRAPAVTAIGQIDGAGTEQIRVSRLPLDVLANKRDYSQDPKFTAAVVNGIYYGPVYFVDASEPYMTLSVAGPRPYAGVNIADVSLNEVQRIVSATKIGDHGVVYVVDDQGRVIAHSDISLVQRDFSSLAQVQIAREAGSAPQPDNAQVAWDSNGREVLTSYAAVARLRWLVLVELPMEEVNAPASPR